MTHSKTDDIAAVALHEAANHIEQYVENSREHYDGTDYNQNVGPRETFRRAFNTAHDHTVAAPTSGDEFDVVEDTFSDALTMALEHDLAGMDAVEFYRNRAAALEN